MLPDIQYPPAASDIITITKELSQYYQYFKSQTNSIVIHSMKLIVYWNLFLAAILFSVLFLVTLC